MSLVFDPTESIDSSTGGTRVPVSVHDSCSWGRVFHRELLGGLRIGALAAGTENAAALRLDGGGLSTGYCRNGRRHGQSFAVRSLRSGRNGGMKLLPRRWGSWLPVTASCVVRGGDSRAAACGRL